MQAGSCCADVLRAVAILPRQYGFLTRMKPANLSLRLLYRHEYDIMKRKRTVRESSAMHAKLSYKCLEEELLTQ